MRMPPLDVMIVPSSALFIELLIMSLMRGGCRESHARRGRMALGIMFQYVGGLG